MGELREDPRLRDRRRPFADRAEGGANIARMLSGEDVDNAALLAVPPGGIPVARAIAEALSLEWGLFFAQRLEHPETGQALGGIAWGGRTVWERSAVRCSDLAPRQLRSLRRNSLDNMRRRARRYGYRPFEGMERIILVDDGTSGWPAMLAAVREIRSSVNHIALAMPIATRAEILRLVNEVEVLICPSVGREDRLVAQGGYWRGPLSEAEGLTAWFSRINGPENTRNPYHMLSSSSDISYDR